MVEIRNAYRISVGKPDAMNMEDVIVDDIKMDSKGIGCKSAD
jgi:hypothetical protein